MRTLSALGLSALGVPLLVLACTPKVRPDPPSFGGSGGAGGAMSSVDGASSSDATTGAGGSGGSAPIGSCTKAGQPFTILGATELDGTPKLDDKIYLVPDAAGPRKMIHVVVADNGMNRLLVRTILDDPSPLGNFTQNAGLNAPIFRPSGVQIDAGQLLIVGTYGSNVAQLAFPIDPDKGVGVDGSVQTLPTPIECLQGGHPGKVAFALGTAAPPYLVTCLSDTPGQPAGLFVSDGVNAPVQLVSKDQSAPEMAPALYTVKNGTHLVFFGGDQQGTFFSQGATVGELAALQPFHLTPTPVALEAVFASVPLPADDGVTLISAFFDTTKGKGQFLSGPVLAKDYASLAKVPPPGLTPIQNVPMLADVAPIFFPTWDATGILGGGASTDGATARFFWFTRDGKPLVFGQNVYTKAGSTILTASAASLGDITKLVVWVERNDSTSPPTYSVNGQKLICQIKS